MKKVSLANCRLLLGDGLRVRRVVMSVLCTYLEQWENISICKSPSEGCGSERGRAFRCNGRIARHH